MRDFYVKKKFNYIFFLLTVSTPKPNRDTFDQRVRDNFLFLSVCKLDFVVLFSIKKKKKNRKFHSLAWPVFMGKFAIFFFDVACLVNLHFDPTIFVYDFIGILFCLHNLNFNSLAS